MAEFAPTPRDSQPLSPAEKVALLRRASEYLDNGEKSEAVKIARTLGLGEANLEQAISAALRGFSKHRGQPVDFLEGDGSGGSQERSAKLRKVPSRTSQFATGAEDNLLQFAGLPLARHLAELVALFRLERPFVLTPEIQFRSAPIAVWGKRQALFPTAMGIEAAMVHGAPGQETVVHLVIQKSWSSVPKALASDGMAKHFRVQMTLVDPRTADVRGDFMVKPVFDPSLLTRSGDSNSKEGLTGAQGGRYSFSPQAVVSRLQAEVAKLSIAAIHTPFEETQNCLQELGVRGVLSTSEGLPVANLSGGACFEGVLHTLPLKEDLTALRDSGDLQLLLAAARTGQDVGAFQYIPRSVAREFLNGFRGASRPGRV